MRPPGSLINVRRLASTPVRVPSAAAPTGASLLLVPLVAASLALVYLVAAPDTQDFAAQTFRTALFERHGFTLWNGAWYGGHHTPGYSVLFPPLAAVLGARVVAVSAAIAAAVIFERLAREHFGERARLGAVWFAAATAVNLFTGRLTFALGIALGLGALLASQRGRRAAAVGFAFLCPLASPVAGLFLALAAVAAAVATRGDRRVPAALAFAALVPALVLSVAFPEGGVEPFVTSAFWPVLAASAIGLVLIPRRERVLRLGIVLYALAATASFVLATPMGGNVARLGTLFGGSLLACALPRRRMLALVLLAVPLLYWQWYSPVRDVLAATDDPSVNVAYFAPLDRFLADHPPAGRVEIPSTRNKYEAAYVADRFPIARGWERQLDIKYNRLFYRPTLSAAAYRAWLDREGVSYVALADAPLDYAARTEAALVRRGVPYLRPVWRSRHWRVFAVEPATSLTRGPARLIGLGNSSFTVVASRPGTVLVRVRFTPYWKLVRGQGCVQRSPDGMTVLRLRSPGRARVSASFAPGRVLSSGPRCTAPSRLASP